MEKGCSAFLSGFPLGGERERSSEVTGTINTANLLKLVVSLHVHSKLEKTCLRPCSVAWLLKKSHTTVYVLTFKKVIKIFPLLYYS